MKKIVFICLIFFLLVSCSGEQEVTNTGAEMEVWMTMNHSSDTTIKDDISKQSLSNSPRHQEWVEIDNNGKTIHVFVVYPENKENSSAVVMIHENKWLNDWARSMADQVAAEGYIVIAPDLLSSFDDERQKTSDFVTPDDATQALYSLSQEDISSDLQAVANYAKTIETFNGNLVSAGFCWGGTQSFELSRNENYKASLVFYGTTPQDESFYSDVKVPVYWFYAENDDRVNAGIQETDAEMQANGKVFNYEIYDGVGHAFMRKADTDAGDELANAAKTAAFERMKEILAEYK